MSTRIQNNLIPEIQNIKKTKQVASDNMNTIFPTRLDGVIQSTKQRQNGDCWILTNLNAMASTPWGAKMIKDAIKPDWNGNVVITFKGSRGEQKEFNVSAEEIVIARENNKYPEGDDDVIAFELALEKYLKLYADKHDRVVTSSDKAGELLDGSRGFSTKDFVELISGEPIDDEHYHVMYAPQLSMFKNKEQDEYFATMEKTLQEIAKNPNKYMVAFSYKNDCTIMSEPPVQLLKQHAYQLKNVITDSEGRPDYVIMVNPHDSSKEVKVPYPNFVSAIYDFEVIENPKEKPNPNIEFPEDVLSKKVEYGKLAGKIMEDGDITKEELKELSAATTSKNIDVLFNNKTVIRLIVKLGDVYESGWGNGKDKKALIEPFVTSYCEYALNQGVDEATVDEVKKACMAELDALLYTNEDVIIESLQNLFDKIDEKLHPEKKFFKDFGGLFK